ncbi:MAG TPA: hypothetical protein VGT41_04340 [Candidatus Babeliales bacterium]|nr:hypothetical protein [Candidatus Babeliales bacterium]
MSNRFMGNLYLLVGALFLMFGIRPLLWPLFCIAAGLICIHHGMQLRGFSMAQLMFRAWTGNRFRM